MLGEQQEKKVSREKKTFPPQDQGLFRLPHYELEFTYARSSGPGGQNVNKTNSKVHLRWHVLHSFLPSDVKLRFIDKFRTKIDQDGFVMVASQSSRDQEQNRQDCIAKLEAMIEEVWLAPKKRRPTKPTKGSKERRLADKTQRSQIKKDRRKKAQQWD
jgi:ribosome-associated protein